MRLECSFHIGGKRSQELWCNEKPVLQHFRFQRASWHFVCFCPCFRFSSSKTKFLNCRLLAVGLGCVNPTQSKASLQFFCRVEMVRQEQRTAPDAAEQTETERLRAAEAHAQEQAGMYASDFLIALQVFFFTHVEGTGLSWVVMGIH